MMQYWNESLKVKLAMRNVIGKLRMIIHHTFERVRIQNKVIAIYSDCQEVTNDSITNCE